MNLTAAQIQTLKAGINGNATAAAFPNTNDGNFACDAFLNGTASPTLSVWKTNVSGASVVSTISAQVGVFSALTAVKQNQIIFMMQAQPIDASQSGIRQSFVDVFGSGSATVIALTAISQRSATYFESFFATGGPPATVALDALGNSLFGQLVDYATVQLARNS